MTDGVVHTVLTGVLTWEAEAVRAHCLLREGIMHEVDIARGPLLVVLDEFIVEVTLREVVRTMLIVTYTNV